MKNLGKLVKISVALMAIIGIFCPAFLFGAGVIGFVLLNPASITWSGKEVQSLSETIMTGVYNDPELENLVQIYQGIVAKQQIVYMGTLSKIVKKDAGCGTGVLSPSVAMSQKFWAPERCKFWLSECVDNYQEIFFVWAQKKGINRNDLTEGELATFITERMTDSLKKDLMRIAWFNDVNHGNISDSPAGVITDGVSLTDYNIIDGFWAQIYDIVAADATKRYTITENAAVTKVLQDTLAADRALAMLRDMLQKADKRLSEQTDIAFYLTDSLVNNYQTYLESQSNSTSFARIEGVKYGGFETGLSFRNIPIYRMSFWDRTIRADFDNGTTYYQPHRAVLTSKANLGVGVEDLASLKDMEVWYEKMEQTNNFRGGFKIDAKVIENHMIQVAY